MRESSQGKLPEKKVITNVKEKEREILIARVRGNHRVTLEFQPSVNTLYTEIKRERLLNEKCNVLKKVRAQKER